MGLFDPNRVEILIRKGMTEDETLKTLIHELMHGFEYEYDIKISHRDIYSLEEAVFDFFCANADILYK